MAEPRPPALVIFREEQRFTQAWLWILLVGGLGLSVASVLPIFIKCQQRPWPPALWLSVAFPVLFMLAILILFASIRMVTEVRSDAIQVSFRPFQGKPKAIPYSEIAEYRSVTYRPIFEYGGWGIRRGRTGHAYNVSGNQGLLLALKNGRTFLIGSQQPERLKAAVDSATRMR